MAQGSRLQELTAQYMQNPRRYFVPLANAYRQAGDLDRAIAICREQLPQQPGHMSGHIVLGRAYFAKGDLDAAREVFMTSFALDDENVVALRHLGEIARARQATVEARQWFARLLESDPHDGEVAVLIRALETDAASDPAAGRESAAAPVETRVFIEPQLSALADPTPPGLRAIVGERSPIDVVRMQPESAEGPPLPVVRVLQTFDLSTLDDVGGDVGRDVERQEPEKAPVDGVPDGAEDAAATDDVASGLIGFPTDELDSFSLIEPGLLSAEATVTSGLPAQLPASYVRPAVATPLDNAAIDADPRDGDRQPGELLTRPGFGALASFASWRSQQERNTPAPGVPAVDERAAIPTPAVDQEPDDDVEAFWSGSADATVTPPEFVTETMAALYVQQGFTQQALDVYRELLTRTPDSHGLQVRIAELEASLPLASAPASLQEEADNALQFHDFEGSTSLDDAAAATLSGLFDETAFALPHDVLSADFDSGWADPQVVAPEKDDWFAGEEQLDPIVARDFEPVIGMFGVDAIDAAVFPAPADASENLEVATVGAGAVAPLDAVFGMPAIATADAAAGDILARLAVQMVGRLPKEAPTLPTPEVLELPTPVAAVTARSGSPAPLLSFDRFFSGSGAAPRARIDTPRASTGTAGVRPSGASTPTPSLSPTFGGVPVVPTPDSVPTPTWPGFDQFLPDRRRAAPAPLNVTAPPAPLSSPARTTAPPAFTPAQAVTGDRSSVSATPPGSRPSASSDQKVLGNAAADASSEELRTVPSDFHRWLEGLS